jgi:glycolate oxidase
VLANGDIVWLGGKTLDTPGYDLRGVVVGSEGMLAIVTKVVVRLMREPESIVTLLAVFHTVDEAGQCVSDIIGRGFIPAALEMIDKATIEAVEPAIHAGYPPDAGAVLLIEVDGLYEAVVEQARDIRSICLEDGAVEVRWAEEQAERDRLWAGRKGAIGALGRLAPNYYIVDGVVPRSKLPQVMRQVAEVGEKYGFRIANVFHAGDGNLHPNLLFDESVPGMVERVLSAGGEIMRLCVDAGGSISGEHGVGVEKRSYISWLFSDDDMEMMRRVQAAFGAEERFNPGKVFPSSKGCGEASQSALRAFGPDAYI